MSYKGYSFNLHKEDDRELIDWLSNKKVTKTIKIALYNQMRSENGNAADDSSMELLSVIKKVIENNNGINNEQPVTVEKVEADVAPKQDGDKKSLSDEDIDDFEKIFDI